MDNPTPPIQTPPWRQTVRTIEGGQATTFVNHSVTLNGSAQQIVQANSNRQGLYLQAPSTNTAPVWIDITGGTTPTTSSPAVELAPGRGVKFVNQIPQTALYVIGTSNDKLTVFEF